MPQVTYLDVSVPQLLADLHTLLEHTSEALTTEGHDVGIDLTAAETLGALLALEASFGNGEDTVHSEGDTNTGNLSLRLEHAHQVVVATTGGDTAHTESGVIRTVIII